MITTATPQGLGRVLRLSSLLCFARKPRRQNDRKESEPEMESDCGSVLQCGSISAICSLVNDSPPSSPHAHKHRDTQSPPMLFGVCRPDRPWWWFVPNSRKVVVVWVGTRDSGGCARARERSAFPLCLIAINSLPLSSPVANLALPDRTIPNSLWFIIISWICLVKSPFKEFAEEMGGKKQLQCDWKMIYLVSVSRVDRRTGLIC